MLTTVVRSRTWYKPCQSCTYIVITRLYEAAFTLGSVDSGAIAQISHKMFSARRDHAVIRTVFQMIATQMGGYFLAKPSGCTAKSPPTLSGLLYVE